MIFNKSFFSGHSEICSGQASFLRIKVCKVYCEAAQNVSQEMQKRKRGWLRWAKGTLVWGRTIEEGERGGGVRRGGGKADWWRGCYCASFYYSCSQ